MKIRTGRDDDQRFMFGHLHWYMWDGAMEETTEMLSMSRPLPSTVIVGVPARKYISKKKKYCVRDRRHFSVSVFILLEYMGCRKREIGEERFQLSISIIHNTPLVFLNSNRKRFVI